MFKYVRIVSEKKKNFFCRELTYTFCKLDMFIAMQQNIAFVYKMV